MRRLLYKTLAVIAATLAITLCALTSQRMTKALLPSVEVALTKTLGRSVRIGRLTVVALPPRLIVDQVDIGPKDADTARIDGNLSIEQVRITPGIWPLVWARTWTLKEVEIVRPNFELSEQGVVHKAEDAAPKLQLPIDVRRVRIEDGQLNLLAKAGRAQIGGLQLDIQPTGFSGRTIALEITQLSVHGFGLAPLAPEWTGELHGAGALAGSLAQPKQLLVDVLEIAGTGVFATISGDCELQDGQAKLRLGSEVRAHLQELSAFVPALAGWQGDALMQLSLVGTPQKPHLGTELVLEPIVTPSHQDLGQIRARIELKRNSVVAERFVWRPKGMRGHAALSGSGQIELRAPYRVRGAVKLDELASDALWALTKTPHGPIEATCSGPVRAQGTLAGPEPMTAKLDVHCQNFAIYGKPTGPKRPGLVLWPTLDVNGSIDVTRGEAKSQLLVVTSPAGPIGVSGRVGWAPGELPSVQLHAQAKTLELDALGPIANLRYGGEGRLEASVVGRWPQIEVTMPFEAQNLRIGPVFVGESRGSLGFAAGLLTISDVLVSRPSGTLSGLARIALAGQKPELVTNLGVHGLEASEILFALGVPQSAARHMHARLWGQLHAIGPLKAPEGRGHLKTPQVSVGDVQLGPGELDIEFADGKRWVGGALRVRSPGGEVLAQAMLSRDAKVALTLEATRLPLALWPELARNEIRGAAHARLEMHGPLKELMGEGHLEIPNLIVAGHEMGACALSATLHYPSLGIVLSAGDSQLAVDAKALLKSPFPVRMHVKMQQLHVGELLGVPALRAPLALRELGVALSAEGDLFGRLDEPSKFEATISLRALEGMWRNVNFKLREKAALRIAHERLEFQNPIRLLGTQLGAELRGSLPLGAKANLGPIALSLAADGDLALIQAWVKDIDAAHGPLRVRGTMGGTWQKPSLLGEIELRRGSMRWQKSEHTLEQIALKAIFSGQAVAITQGSARLGRGRIRLTGEAAPKDGRLSELGRDLSLRLNLLHIPIEPSNDIQAQISGNLELSGGALGPSLSGLLRIESLRYAARIDLDRLVPKRAAPPLRAPLLTGFSPLKLHVQLQAPNNLIVLSSVLESELACDLTLTGSTARMGLLGSVTPLWARARWRNNTFVLTRASIDFVDEFRIAPQYSVRAHTEACNMQAEVLVEGSVDGFNVVPSGRDERGVVDPQDVLSCLQLGLRLRDFDGNQRGGATMDDALRSSLDALWTVSGLDDKVRKMLPIGVDELRLTSGWSSIGQRTTARVLVGKDLGKRVALRYSRSLDEYNDQAFSLDYRLAERATMQGNWVSTRDVPVGDLGLDLRLHWEIM